MKNLVPTPQAILRAFPCYTNKLYGTTVISTSHKKNKKKKKLKKKKKKKKKRKKRIPHPFLKPWRALRHNIFFFSLNNYFQTFLIRYSTLNKCFQTILLFWQVYPSLNEYFYFLGNSEIPFFLILLFLTLKAVISHILPTKGEGHFYLCVIFCFDFMFVCLFLYEHRTHLWIQVALLVDMFHLNFRGKNT